MIHEANEVSLVIQLQKSVTEWVKDIRFTLSKISSERPTLTEMSITPKVYKYYLPERTTDKPELRRIRADDKQFVPDAKPLYPAIIIRPSGGSEDDDSDNGISYAETKIDIVILVSEYNQENRYSFLLLANKLIRQQLKRIPRKVLAQAYVLQPSLDWQIYDNDQDPLASLTLSTTWRYDLPAGNVGDFEGFFK